MREATVSLLEAAVRGDVPAIEHLLAGGADPNVVATPYGNSALYNACFADRVPVVRVLLNGGADPNLRLTYCSPVDGRIEAGIVALMVCRSVATVQLLLDSGADPNVCDESGCTPLMRAVLSAPPEAVALLLGAGANRSATDSAGRTAADLVRGRMEWLRESWDRLAQPGATRRRAALERVLALLEPQHR